MKRINYILIAALCILTGVSQAFGAKMSVKEKNAQKVVNDYLTNELGYTTKITADDNAVNFQAKGVLFWITFEESDKGILYTLHRRPIKMESPNDNNEKNSRRIENAIQTANLMNAVNAYKTYVTGNKVDFVFPVYAESAAEYTKVFPMVFKSLGNAKDSFDSLYDRGKEKSDSIHEYWAVNDPNSIVVPQPQKPNILSTPNLTISEVDFRIVDENGAEISPYGKSIRKSELLFIQPQVTVSASKKGVYHIGMTITTPDGRIMLPSVKADRTAVTTCEVDKKPTAVPLATFGSKDGDIWEAGEYKVVFYEGNNILKETSFTVL